MEITKEEMLQRFREVESHIDEYRKLELEYWKYEDVYDQNSFENTLIDKLKEDNANRLTVLFSIGVMVAVTYLLKFLGFEFNIHVLLIMFLSLIVSFICFNHVLCKKYKIKHEGFSIVSVGGDAYMKAKLIKKRWKSATRKCVIYVHLFQKSIVIRNHSDLCICVCVPEKRIMFIV